MPDNVKQSRRGFLSLLASAIAVDPFARLMPFTQHMHSVGTTGLEYTLNQNVKYVSELETVTVCHQDTFDNAQIYP